MNLIIGGSGFVGSCLISKLDNKETINMDKNDSPFFNDITLNCNICDIDSLKFPENTKNIVLLAAEHRDDVSPHSLYYDVNVEGTKNVLKAMDKYGIKNLIFTSSVAIYGLNKVNPDESHIEDPFNHYGKSKWEAEKVIRQWYATNPYGKSVSIIRPTVIFGERNRGNVYNLLKQIASGRFIMIGDGENKKSMAYVENVAMFIKNCLVNKKKGCNTFNYVDKPDLSMKELVSIIETKMNIFLPKQKIPYWLGLMGGYVFDFISYISNKKTSITSVRVKKFCATTQFNSDKANDLFKVPYSLDEGLIRTLEHEFINTKDDNVLFYSE